MVAQYLQTIGDNRTVITNSRGEYFGAANIGAALVPQGAVLLGKVSFDNWLSAQKQVVA
jgi:hypothetical protein